MKESEILITTLAPVVDALGISRAIPAMAAAKPVMDAVGALLTASPDKQVALDAVRVIELWCRAIRELGDKVEAKT